MAYNFYIALVKLSLSGILLFIPIYFWQGDVLLKFNSIPIEILKIMSQCISKCNLKLSHLVNPSQTNYLHHFSLSNTDKYQMTNSLLQTLMESLRNGFTRNYNRKDRPLLYDPSQLLNEDQSYRYGL